MKKIKEYKKINRPPRLFLNKKGHRYIRLKNKKIKIDSPLNNKNLVKVIINNAVQSKTIKRIRRNAPLKKALHSLKAPFISGSTNDLIIRDLKNDLTNLKNERLLLKKAIENNEKKETPLITYDDVENITDNKYATITLPNGKKMKITEKELNKKLNYQNKLEKNLNQQQKDLYEKQKANEEMELKIKKLEEETKEKENLLIENQNKLNQIDEEQKRIEEEQKRQEQENELYLNFDSQFKNQKGLYKNTYLSQRENIINSNLDFFKENLPKAFKKDGSITKSKADLTTREIFNVIKNKGDNELKKMVGINTDDGKLEEVEEEEEPQEEKPPLNEEIDLNVQIGEGLKLRGRGLWNDEIDELMEPFRKEGYLGTISSDQIKTLIKKVKKGNKYSFIMNLSPSDKKGSHWVAVYIDPVDDLSLEYYDPLAQPPSKEFQKDIKYLIDKLKPETYLKFKINRIRDQRKNSYTCGWHAINFLEKRYNDIPFKEASGYVDSVDGEKEVKNLKKKLGFGYI